MDPAPNKHQTPNNQTSSEASKNLPTQSIETVPDSFATYHLNIAFPNFVKTRPKHIKAVLDNFNIFGLLTNLIAPYKRMEVKGKVSLGEKLSFNLISRLVGAMARSALMIAGILVTIFFIFFDILAIPLYLIFPIISYLKYTNLVQKHITGADIAANRVTQKLLKTRIFATLATFFDQEFVNLFSNFQSVKTLNIQPGQKTYVPFLNLADNWEALGTYLKKISVKPKEFQLLISYLNDYLNAEQPIKPTPLGEMLIFGYTNTLEKYGKELTKLKHPPFYGKDEILSKIEKILTRPQNNNVLLIGEAGVGKHAVLESLAAAIAKGQLASLRDKRLIVLDIIALLASSKNIAEVQGNLEKLLEEAKRAGNIILALDEVDRICSPNDGRVDLSEVLTSMLTDNSLPLVGISTIDNFNGYIRPNSNMTSLFERIDVEEPTGDELMTILIGKALEIYTSQKIATSLTAILEIMDKSTRLLADKKQPEKSLLVLSDSIAETAAKKQDQVDVEIVDSVISQKTKTPVGKISQTEAQKLTDLEKILHQRIVGQNEAVDEISRAMRRARAELKQTTKPMGSFLFLGPTGVGKTETAKALAQAYFSDENKMVRFDMTEFQGTDSLQRLIGNPQTKTQGQLTTQIREHPFGILLVDEFEKASQDVQNLFLQILDEGNLTDAFGKKVSFTNIIVIATSNAAAEYIREEVQKGSIDLQKKLVDYVLEKGLFSPELINRFDATVVFHPLAGQEVVQVAYLMLQSLAKQLKENKNIALEITPDLAQLVATKGYIVAFGARPIKRLIQDKIEDQIAKLMLEGKLGNGDTIPAQTLLQFLA
ncbi:MAG: ATP-dependent Clp protease ATP-binding subunit [Patescibacteria group bacterium]